MPTKLYLRDTFANAMGLTSNPMRRDMLTTPGSSVKSDVVNTSAGGTEIQWTDSAGGAVVEWISPPLTAGFTLATTDTMTFNIWAYENNVNANIGARVRVYRFSRWQGGLIEVAGSPWNDGVEFDTSMGVLNWTGSPSSNMSFVRGDRIVIRLYITNVGTMGDGYIGGLDYDGPTNGADGDSWFQVSNTITFDAETIDALGVGLDFLQRQPRAGIGVIAGHPLAPRYAWSFADVTPYNNARIHALVGGRPARMMIDSGLSGRKIVGGLSLREGLQGIELPSSGHVFPTNRYTVVLVARRYVTENGDQAGFWWGVPSGTTPFCQYASSEVDFWSEGTGVIPVAASAGDGLDLLKDSVYVFASGSRGREIWQDGRLLKSAALPTPNLSSSYTDHVAVGRHSSAYGDWLGVAYFAVYHRQLSPIEIQMVSRAPF